MDGENIPQYDPKNNLNGLNNQSSPEGRRKRKEVTPADNSSNDNNNENLLDPTSLLPSPARSNAAWALASLFQDNTNSNTNSNTVEGPNSINTNHISDSNSCNSINNVNASSASQSYSVPSTNSKKKRKSTKETNGKLSRNNSMDTVKTLSRNNSIDSIKTLSRNNSTTSMELPGKSLSRNNSIEGYSRQEKSLSNLCSHFIELYGKYPQDAITIQLDQAALKLGVERRRLYDILNILDPLGCCFHLMKNIYMWHGYRDLFNTLRRLQRSAIQAWPQEALAAGMSLPQGSQFEKQNQLPSSLSSSSSLIGKQQQNSSVDTSVKAKTLVDTCTRFLHMFLLGHKIVSLTMANDRALLEESNDSQHSSSKDSAKEPMKASQTKMRRLYDIANVFASIGLIRKIKGSRPNKLQGEPSLDPSFEWIGPPPMNIFHGIDNGAFVPSISEKATQTNQIVKERMGQFPKLKVQEEQEGKKDLFSIEAPPALSRTGTFSSLDSLSTNTGPFSPSCFFNSQTSENHFTPPEDIEFGDTTTPREASSIVETFLSPPHSARQPNTGGGGGSHHISNGAITSSTTSASTCVDTSVGTSDCLDKKLHDSDWPTPCDGSDMNLPLPPDKMLEFQVERLRKFMDDYQDRWFKTHPMEDSTQNIYDQTGIVEDESAVTACVKTGGEGGSPPLFTKLSDVSVCDQATAGIIKCDIECEE